MSIVEREVCDMSQCLELGVYKPAFSLWMQTEFEVSPLVIPDSKVGGKCCYQGCCEMDPTSESGMVTVCKNGHLMHPKCFLEDLADKMSFRDRFYMCYQCDDRSLDFLYRSILCNANFENVFPMALTAAGASVFASVQAIAVGNEEYNRFLAARKK